MRLRNESMRSTRRQLRTILALSDHTLELDINLQDCTDQADHFNNKEQ